MRLLRDIGRIRICRSLCTSGSRLTRWNLAVFSNSAASMRSRGRICAFPVRQSSLNLLATHDSFHKALGTATSCRFQYWEQRYPASAPDFRRGNAGHSSFLPWNAGSIDAPSHLPCLRFWMRRNACRPVFSGLQTKSYQAVVLLQYKILHELRADEPTMVSAIPANARGVLLIVQWHCLWAWDFQIGTEGKSQNR